MTWDKDTLAEIDYKAKNAKYRVRGCASPKTFPTFDDLMVLPGQMTRMTIDTYREPCETRVSLGGRFAKKPVVIETPIMLAGMSYGAISKEAKIAIAKASAIAGTVTSNGEGGIIPEERDNAYRYSVQVLASRMGFTKRNIEVADMIEVVFGIGAKPGLSGHLLGSKITKEIAEFRQIPEGLDLYSHPRAGDAFGADDMIVKMQQMREMTNWETPIFCKIAAGRVKEDVRLAVKSGYDGIILDGCTAGTGAAPVIASDNLGIPALPALVQAVRELEDMGVKDEVTLIISGGIKDGADIAKALAIGANAVAIGTAALVSMGCRVCGNCQAGNCPLGIGTQKEELRAKFDIDANAQRLANYLKAITEEAAMLAKAAGKTKLRNLEREDLRSATLLACAATGIPLIGGDYTFGDVFGFL
ncbi:hypothetical protein FACS1894188_07400 [Clostridia bacterium]|nr:hypothetical protein FACS1894188_07400 [Clostridia bacterium]